MSSTPNDGSSPGHSGSEGRRRGRSSLWKQTPVTWAFIIVNVLWFFIVEGLHGLSVSGLVKSGALDWYDVAVGAQWWRLFSAMFVHFSFAHLGINMVSLASLYIIEWLIGSPFFVVTYLLGGFVGDLATFWLSGHQVISAGASGAIFAIFGVALYMSLRGILTKTARNQLIVLLIFNLVYGFSSSDIGNVAHIGGLVTGIAMGAWFVKQPRLRVSRYSKWGSYALIVLSVTALLLTLPGNSPALNGMFG